MFCLEILVPFFLLIIFLSVLKVKLSQNCTFLASRFTVWNRPSTYNSIRETLPSCLVTSQPDHVQLLMSNQQTFFRLDRQIQIISFVLPANPFYHSSDSLRFYLFNPTLFAYSTLWLVLKQSSQFFFLVAFNNIQHPTIRTLSSYRSIQIWYQDFNWNQNKINSDFKAFHISLLLPYWSTFSIHLTNPASRASITVHNFYVFQSLLQNSPESTSCTIQRRIPSYHTIRFLSSCVSFRIKRVYSVEIQLTSCNNRTIMKNFCIHLKKNLVCTQYTMPSFQYQPPRPFQNSDLET